MGRASAGAGASSLLLCFVCTAQAGAASDLLTKFLTAASGSPSHRSPYAPKPPESTMSETTSGLNHPAKLIPIATSGHPGQGHCGVSSRGATPRNCSSLCLCLLGRVGHVSLQQCPQLLGSCYGFTQCLVFSCKSRGLAASCCSFSNTLLFS